MAEEVWDCKPLVVIDDTDGTIAFAGEAYVDMHPNEDRTANLVSRKDRDGWYPSLEHARVWSISGGMYSGVRPGMGCSGKDREGNPFHWYINGGAESYVADHWPELGGGQVVAEEPEAGS